MSDLTSADILSRAIEIVTTGPMKHPIDSHGQFCPWCAIGQAKGDIEREHEVSTFESVAGKYDFQLYCAREALGRPVVGLSRNEALIILRRALEKESK